MDSVIEDYNDRLKSLGDENIPEKEYSELTKHDVLMGNLKPKHDARWIKD
ncbi:MAG: hypothetical protein U0J50_10325 [Peptacetobacter hiranonis]|jgi:hypothetical protein|nr:hypothetical protein [uncultured Romboutsia sp.]MED9948634.1 hypothetical protein [Peptacetobacter hiranonis]MEE0616750.1 hypothetical protein [Intestinibacter bartlettii]UVX60916.1 MAG: hypothetical protein [Bacteriophage sp.]DAQ09357.1 MAG TPA: hypothetical protein [Caudoviricetes sp.]